MPAQTKPARRGSAFASFSAKNDWWFRTKSLKRKTKLLTKKNSQSSIRWRQGGRRKTQKILRICKANSRNQHDIERARSSKICAKRHFLYQNLPQKRKTVKK